MSARLAAVVVLLAAGGLWLLVTAPANRAREAAGDQLALARTQRERLRVALSAAERRGAIARTPEAGAAAARAVRASLLRATEGLAVDDVQISPSAGERTGASGRISAEGRMAEVVQLADRLVRDDSGVVVQRVSLTSARADSPAVRLEVDCVSGSLR